MMIHKYMWRRLLSVRCDVIHQSRYFLIHFSSTIPLRVPRWFLFQMMIMMMMLMTLKLSQMVVEVSKFVLWCNTMSLHLLYQKPFFCSFIQLLMLSFPFLLHTISHQFSSSGGPGLSGWTETRSAPDFTAHGSPKQHGCRTIWPGSER